MCDQALMKSGTKPLEYDRLCFISDDHYIIIDTYESQKLRIASIDTDDKSLLEKLEVVKEISQDDNYSSEHLAKAFGGN